MNRNAIIAVGLLVVAAVAVLVFDSNRNPAQHPKIGSLVINPSELPNISEVNLTKSDKTLKIRKNDLGLWSVDHDGVILPADGRKIATSFDQISKAKITRLISKSAESDQGFEAGVKLSLISAAGPIDFNLGEKRAGGGQYISLGQGPEVFLTSENIDIATDLDAWELKTLVDLKKEEIKKVEFWSAKKGAASTTLLREKAEDKLAVQGLGKEEKTRESALGTIESALEALSFSKRLDPGNEEAKTALSHAQQSRFESFDGRVYDVWVGKVGKDASEKYFVRVTASKGNSSLSTQQNAEIDLLNELMSKWSYEVSSYNAKRLIKERADLVESDKS
jgi:hypothetical protein